MRRSGSAQSKGPVRMTVSGAAVMECVRNVFRVANVARSIPFFFPVVLKFYKAKE